MDEELRLWAINVDEFRGCFAPSPALEETLRGITRTSSSSSVEVRHGGLLSKLGPLMRHPVNAPLVRRNQPSVLDGEAMMASRYIGADRRHACWELSRSWLDELASAHKVVPLPRSNVDAFEFDLARVGVPTQLSIRHLWARNLDIPLYPTDDMSIGYTAHHTIPHYLQSWRQALTDMEDDTRSFAEELLGFMEDHYPPEPDPATSKARVRDEKLDLIAWWTSR